MDSGRFEKSSFRLSFQKCNHQAAFPSLRIYTFLLESFRSAGFRNSMRIIRISKLFKRKSNFRIFGGKIAIYCHYLVYFRGYLFAALQLASPTSRKRKENRENPGGMDGEDPRGRGWINHIPTFASKRQILAPLAPPSYPSPSLFPDWIAIIDSWKIPSTYSPASRIFSTCRAHFSSRTLSPLYPHFVQDNQERERGVPSL